MIYLLLFFTFSLVIIIIQILLAKIMNSNNIVSKFDHYFSKNKSLIYLTKSEEGNELNVSSNIVFGKSDAEFVLSLHIHLNCKFCPEAFRESLNLVLLDERFKMNLFVHCGETDIDTMYLSQLINDLMLGNAAMSYSTFIRWKTRKPIKISITDEIIKKKRLHRTLCDKNRPLFYPSLTINNKYLYNFAGYENVKIALALS